MLPKVSNGEPESGGRHFMYLFIVYRGKEKKEERCGSQKVCDDAESSPLHGHLILLFPQYRAYRALCGSFNIHT